MLSARILMALAAIAGAFVLTVVGAEAASAGTIEVSADEIVYRSDRLHSNQVHLTVIVTLRSNGDWTVRLEANNTAATRKFVNSGGSVYSPAADAGAGHWSHSLLHSGGGNQAPRHMTSALTRSASNWADR